MLEKIDVLLSIIIKMIKIAFIAFIVMLCIRVYNKIDFYIYRKTKAIKTPLYHTINNIAINIDDNYNLNSKTPIQKVIEKMNWLIDVKVEHSKITYYDDRVVITLDGTHSDITQELKKQACAVYTRKVKASREQEEKRITEEWRKLYCN